MRRALLIVGKSPAAGQTKTRLVPPLSADEAAQLYRGFLLDTVNLGLDLGWEFISVAHPRGCADALRALLPPEVDLFEQPGHGLQDALASAFAAHLAAGFDRVVLIGSDNPTLPRRLLDEACRALLDHDLVIGPSMDGGYYLVGMCQPHLGVFEAIDWSTARVFAQTLARAQALGLRTHAVDAWYDVDDLADLDRLQHDLRSGPAWVAPQTRATLERLAPVAAQR
jgi:uncharacterized protein